MSDKTRHFFCAISVCAERARARPFFCLKCEVSARPPPPPPTERAGAPAGGRAEGTADTSPKASDGRGASSSSTLRASVPVGFSFALASCVRLRVSGYARLHPFALRSLVHSCNEPIRDKRTSRMNSRTANGSAACYAVFRSRSIPRQWCEACLRFAYFAMSKGYWWKSATTEPSSSTTTHS